MNRILAALRPAEYLRMKFEEVTLEFGKVLCEPGDAIRHAYFPISCLISLLAVVDEGEDLEVGLVGKEGMFGTPLALGSATSPVRALVQGTGRALRLPARRFLAELARVPRLREATNRCIYVAMSTAMQIAACNKAHFLEARLARWLLMVRDRVGRDDFGLTQQLLARMLGVRRAGVTEAAVALQARRLIDYRRGQIRVLDGEGLGDAACSCYGAIREMERNG